MIDPPYGRLGEAMGSQGTPSFANSSLEDPYDYEDDRSLLLPIINMVIFALGIIGNSSVILIIIGFRDMRNIPNLQIMSMAIGDFVYLVMSIPDLVAFSFIREWPFSEFYCKISAASIYVSQDLSALTLAALSADRYYAIARPMARRKINVTKYTLGVVTAIWILSIICGVPVYIMTVRSAAFCHFPYGTTAYRVFLFAQLGAFYIIPLALITLFYSLTAHTLVHGVKTIGQKVRDGNGRRDPHSKARRRLAIIVLVAVVCFAMSWLPYHVYDIWAEFETDYRIFVTPVMTFYMSVKYLLPPISASLNPVILYVMSSNYRRHFKRMFLGWPCCGGKENIRQRQSHTWTLMSAFKTAVPTSRRNSMEFQLKHSSSTLVSHS